MAITRTALGTGESTVGQATVAISAGAISAGDTIICVVASDKGLYPVPPEVRYFYDGSNYEEPTVARDATATNSGNVVTEIIRWTAGYASTSGAYLLVYAYGSSSDSIAVAAIKLSGLAASPFDKASAGTGTGTAPSSGATAETSQADEILIGAVGWEGDMGDNHGTWNGSFSDGQIDGSPDKAGAKGIVINEGYRIVSAAAAYTASKAGCTSRDWAAAIATYKGQAAGTQYEQALTSATASFSAALLSSHGFTKALTSGMAALGATISRIPSKTLTGGLATLAASINKQTRRFLAGG